MCEVHPPTYQEVEADIQPKESCVYKLELVFDLEGVKNPHALNKYDPEDFLRLGILGLPLRASITPAEPELRDTKTENTVPETVKTLTIEIRNSSPQLLRSIRDFAFFNHIPDENTVGGEYNICGAHIQHFKKTEQTGNFWFVVNLKDCEKSIDLSSVYGKDDIADKTAFQSEYSMTLTYSRKVVNMLKYGETDTTSIIFNELPHSVTMRHSGDIIEHRRQNVTYEGPLFSTVYKSCSFEVLQNIRDRVANRAHYEPYFHGDVSELFCIHTKVRFSKKEHALHSTDEIYLDADFIRFRLTTELYIDCAAEGPHCKCLDAHFEPSFVGSHYP